MYGIHNIQYTIYILYDIQSAICNTEQTVPEKSAESRWEQLRSRRNLSINSVFWAGVEEPDNNSETTCLKTFLLWYIKLSSLTATQRWFMQLPQLLGAPYLCWIRLRLAQQDHTTCPQGQQVLLPKPRRKQRLPMACVSRGTLCPGATKPEPGWGRFLRPFLRGTWGISGSSNRNSSKTPRRECAAWSVGTLGL